MTSNERVCPAPRTSWACDICRAKRTRCLSSASPGVCERCLSKHLKCTFSYRNAHQARKPAVRRAGVAGSTPGTVGLPSPASTTVSVDEAGERFLEGLVPTVVRQDEGEEQEAFVRMHAEHVVRLFGGADGKMMSDDRAFEATTCTPFRLTELGSGKKSTASAQRTPFGAEEVRDSLASYQEWFPYFPFFPVGRSEDVTRLQRQRPFLLLAILCGSTPRKPWIRDRLDAEFCRVFNHRAIEMGERSLDLAQAALVYIARFPLEKRPKSRQALQYLRVVADMLGDMDSDALLASEDAVEAARTFLACYYSSSILALTSPSSKGAASVLPYSDAVETALSVVETPREAGATAMIWLVRAQVLAEKAANSHTPASASDPIHITMQTGIESLHAQLCKATIKTHAHTLTLLFASVLVTSQSPANPGPSCPSIPNASLSRAESSHTTASGAGSPTSTYTAPTALLNALQSLFTTLLSLPQVDYAHLTFLDWARVIKSIVLTCKLLFPRTSPLGLRARKRSALGGREDMAQGVRGEDMDQARTFFAIQLESFMFRMQTLSQGVSATRSGEGQLEGDGRGGRDFFAFMGMAVGCVREGVERYSAGVQGGRDDGEEVQMREVEVDGAMGSDLKEGTRKACDEGIRCPVVSGEMEWEEWNGEWKGLMHGWDEGLNVYARSGEWWTEIGLG